MLQRIRAWYADQRFRIEAIVVGFCRGFFSPLLFVWATFGALVQVFNYAPDWCAKNPKLWSIIAMVLTICSLGLFVWAWRRRIGEIEMESMAYRRCKRAAA